MTVDHRRSLVERAVQRAWETRADADESTTTMMAHHFGWDGAPMRGKLLRPLLVLAACEALGGDPRAALPAAVAVELLHNFSLVHDDVQDNSAVRRGRATVQSRWGAAQAINAGDALFVVARNTLLELRETLGAAGTLEVIDRVDRACLELCHGQGLDLRFEGSLDTTVADYLHMARLKTASLLELAIALGAFVATRSWPEAERTGQIGRSLGLAFQIQDDLLGIWGQHHQTGKSSSDDLRRRKKSLPVVHALESTDPAATTLRALYAGGDLSPDQIRQARRCLEQRGSRQFCEAQMLCHRQALAQQLAGLEPLRALLGGQP